MLGFLPYTKGQYINYTQITFIKIHKRGWSRPYSRKVQTSKRCIGSEDTTETTSRQAPLADSGIYNHHLASPQSDEEPNYCSNITDIGKLELPGGDVTQTRNVCQYSLARLLNATKR